MKNEPLMPMLVRGPDEPAPGKRADGSTKKTLGAAMTVTGAVGVGVGVWAFLTVPNLRTRRQRHGPPAQPALREKHGLPVSERQTSSARPRSFAISPYATGSGGGLSVSGRF